jgi:hypothetical protein
MAMPINYARTNQVRLAAEQLQAALRVPEIRKATEVRDAKEWLISAAEQHENDAVRAREHFTSEVSAAKEPEWTAPDIMSVVISDLWVANTLMAAGNVLEETPAKPDPKLLDQALIGIQQSTSIDEDTTRAFAFSSKPLHSTDLPVAREVFRQHAHDTLTDLVSQARGAASTVITAMNKIEGRKLLQALADLGGPMATLPELGNLFRKGMEKMQNALDFLRRMLDSEFLREIKSKISGMSAKVTDGTWTDDLLGWTFNRAAIESLLPKAACSDQFTVDQVDLATGDLAPLAEKFSSEMKWAKAVTTAVSFAGGFLTVAAGVSAGTSALFVGGAYLMTLAAIIVVGRDSVGSGALLHGHRGVQSIVQTLIVL